MDKNECWTMFSETGSRTELVVETTIGHVENKVEIAEEDKTVTSASDVTNAVSVLLIFRGAPKNEGQLTGFMYPE